ncbi:zinc-ribbon domain-containing protein [bacterium]|nr:zinc-ribbon domain-containing protein [bacterium]
MLSFIIISTGLIALAFVLKPLLAKDYIAFDQRDEKTAKLDALISKKNKIYMDIKDLDFEFGIGKMAEEDYRSLRKQSMAEVADVIRQIDIGGGESPAGNGKITDDYLEKLIAAKRKIKVAQGEIVIESQPAILSCSQCGRENNIEAKFCSECGTKLVKD